MSGAISIIKSEYDQERLQSHTADQPTAALNHEEET